MPRANYIQLRFSDQELGAYQALADNAGVALGEWVRNTLNVEVVMNRKSLPLSIRLGLRKSFELTETGNTREPSTAEIACPIRGCTLWQSHSGPCVPVHPDEETREIVEQNLTVLAQDDPEGFRIRIRELLKKGA